MGSVGLLCVEGVGLLRGVWGLESTLVFLLQLQWSVMVAGVAAMECGTQLYLRVFGRYAPHPPRSTTTAVTRRTAESSSNLQMNLRCLSQSLKPRFETIPRANPGNAVNSI